MHGLGYAPLWDVGDQARPAHAAQLAAQARCKKADPTLMGSEQETESGRYFRRNLFYGICDGLYVMKAILEATGGRTAIADVTRGYRAALDGKLASAVLVAGRFQVGGRLDGPGAARPFAYDSHKGGFKYVGPLVAIT
jgi:hypothetical protein